MIGGTVQTVLRFDDRRTLLVRGHDEDRDKLLVIDVLLHAPAIERGDEIWWQSDLAMLIPHSRRDVEIPVNRIGYSYDPDALWPKVLALTKAGICPECAYVGCMANGYGSLWCPRCDASYGLSDETVKVVQP